jgi:hypothetical protein
MVTLKKVIVDDLYETIHSFVINNKVLVEDYEGMVNLIIRMIKEGHCFTMERDILRDAMESLTYMYAPSDEMNKDRLIQQFIDPDDDDSDEDDTQDFGNMDMLKMMQMMGGMPPLSGHSPGDGQDEGIIVKKEGECEGTDTCADSTERQCTVTGECCKEECPSGDCVKDVDTDAKNVD